MINRLKNYLVILFGISSVEAKGLIVIFIFILLLLVFSLVIPRFNSSRYDSYYADKRILDSIVNLLGKDSSPAGLSLKSPTTGKEPAFFGFNPNTATKSELDRLGFPSFLSERLHKYRDSGGNFKIKNDLLKIYGMTDELYLKLEPYIQLPEIIPELFARSYPDTFSAGIKIIHEKFDINLADSVQLLTVNGIGPVLAARVIRFRSRLGGFISLDQLDEIYGLRDPSLSKLKNSCFIGEGFSTSKIKINFAEWADLVKHPYFDTNLANMIINYRDAAGPFHSLDDMRKINGMHDSTILKIGMYIDF